MTDTERNAEQLRAQPGDPRGIQTMRAMDNFRIAGRPVRTELVRAYALVKKACARVNGELGFLDADRAAAIEAICDEIAAGAQDQWFTVDALQGGAGTSTNMNVNEVIAHLASARLGQAGSVEPLRDVNLHQSTNDTYPTALKLCAALRLAQAAKAAEALQGAYQKKETEFASIVAVGRTEMQSAVPMTLGAIFSSFAEAAGRDRWRIFKCEERIRTVNLGGTAVGTGLAAPRDYIFRATDELRRISGVRLARGENLVDQTANADAFAEVAGILSAFAANLEKQASDIRFLSHTGEIRLPALQAGSSIMPGKINPVVCEAVIQAGMKARSLCALVAEAASRGTLQINEFLPLIADSLLEAIDLAERSAEALAAYVALIAANPSVCAELVRRDRMIVTAFLPDIGYAAAEKLLAEFDAARETDGALEIRSFLESRLGAEAVKQKLSPSSLSELGYRRNQ